MPSLKTKAQKWFELSSIYLRTRPHFIIIGAQKAGTTSLFHYLWQHPQVAEIAVKEIHYFDNNYEKGEHWYRSHFPWSFQRRSGVVTGEATPYYLFHPHAAGRMHQALPECKLIVILRNPTERAISHYFHEVNWKTETLDIMEALQSEERRVGNELAKMLQDSSYRSQAHQSFAYKQRGVYIDQLEEYWKYFGKEQILVLNSDHLFADTHATLSRVFEFLGVDAGYEIKDIDAVNIGSNRERVSAEVYAYLDEFFAPHNERLFQALGSDFNWV